MITPATRLTGEQLRAEADMQDRIDRNIARRDNAIKAIGDLRGKLERNGWTRYREGEQLSPDGFCVLRTGYAGGETEVEIKRPRNCPPGREITLDTLRLHRGDLNEMAMEIEQFLFENTGYEL